MACCQCNFINRSDFQTFDLELPENISERKVNSAIRETRFIILKYICPDLWDELCEQIEDDDLTPENEGLLCLIKGIWTRYAFGELYSMNVMQLSKENVVRKFSDQSEAVSFSEAEKMANYWRFKAENFISDLLKYLKDNESENDLYKQCNICGNSDSKAGTSYWGIA